MYQRSPTGANSTRGSLAPFLSDLHDEVIKVWAARPRFGRVEIFSEVDRRRHGDTLLKGAVVAHLCPSSPLRGSEATLTSKPSHMTAFSPDFSQAHRGLGRALCECLVHGVWARQLLRYVETKSRVGATLFKAQGITFDYLIMSEPNSTTAIASSWAWF